MQKPWTLVNITRSGLALPGSPFSARWFFSRFDGKRHEVIPDNMKVEAARALRFQNPLAPVNVGDYVIATATYPAAKIINVCLFQRTLQCDLQIIPYQTLVLWSPTPAAQRVVGLSLMEMNYVPSGSVQGYCDPLSDATTAAALGRLDARTLRCFTDISVPAGSILRGGTDAWFSPNASEYWSASNDYVTTVQRLAIWPQGIL